MRSPSDISTARGTSAEPERSSAPTTEPVWVERAAFPEADPPSWTDPEAILGYQRAAGDTLGEVTETRRGGAEGPYVSYLWTLSFYGEFALRPLLTRATDALVGSGLEVLPPDRIALPLLRIGGSAEVSESQLAHIQRLARDWAIDQHQFRLGVGPPVLGPGGVRFSVTPWNEIHQLQRGLWRGARTVLGYRPWLRERIPFRPHVPLAYAPHPVDAADLRARLAGVAATRPVQVRVRRLTMVRITRQHGQTRWFTVADMALGTRTGFKSFSR